MLPEVVHEPTFHNPFPQLARVAVAPFFNLSAERSVDGRQFASAYLNELQLVPGFEVVPVGVVERKIEQYRLSLASPGDARKLAQLLGVDAVVIGVITDFSPYYPPRCGLRVEWYSANPDFHTIPPGYGLPWGTPQQEEIPDELAFEAEMAQARQLLAYQPPPLPPGPMLLPIPPGATLPPPASSEQLPPPSNPTQPETRRTMDTVRAASTNSALSTIITAPFAAPAQAGLASYPHETVAPILRHTRAYNGHDLQFTARLKDYVYLRDDARFGGWDGYLQRSDDFIRFCCYLHISEMLSARGGAGETRVVWRWSTCR